MQQLWLFIKSRTFFLHLIGAMLGIGLISFLVFTWLDQYTRHNQSVSVPNVKGLRLEEAEELLESQGFRFIVDSLYVDGVELGTVYEQEPAANELVKENRTIYLTSVSSEAPSVKLPELIDVSLREAQAILESYGIVVGKLIYRPDLAQNAVLAVQMNGKDIASGQKLSKGQTVDLVLGDGYGNLKITIPNLIGLSYDEAVFVIQGSKLLVGAIIFESNDNDTANSVIYKQSPEFSTDSTINKISQGEAIDLYLKIK
jgi:eukaryotic-like serine/threonine-protein kinase